MGRPGLSATVRVLSTAFFRKIVTRHDTGLGEAYMDGDYEVSRRLFRDACTLIVCEVTWRLSCVSGHIRSSCPQHLLVHASCEHLKGTLKALKKIA